jgi:1,4-alpha-glucan branching enzyme
VGEIQQAPPSGPLRRARQRYVAAKCYRNQLRYIIASFNNTAFTSGYVIEKDLLAIPYANWKEIFNSDAAIYGGQNIGNGGSVIPSSQGRLNVVVPAAGFLVFARLG